MNVFEQFFSKQSGGEPAKKLLQKQHFPHRAPAFTPDLMAQDVFWKLIRKSYNKAGGDYKRQQQELTALLAAQLPVDCITFQNRFNDYVDQAYRRDLWGVAHIMQDGCSDDCFFDFRGWLISLGKERYHAVLENPEAITEVDYATDEVDWEGISWSAHAAYSQLTGKIMPSAPGNGGDPKGEQWKEEELPERFPAAWAKWAKR